MFERVKKYGLAQLSGTISGAQSRWLFGASQQRFGREHDEDVGKERKAERP